MHMSEKKKLKLHLGCGTRIIPGYVNIDIQQLPGVDMVCDISKLPYANNSVDFIYACAVLEHFGRKIWPEVLKHWYAKLNPGGTVRISTNDFEAAADRYRKTNNLSELLGLLIGGQKDKYDWHGIIFDFNLLKEGLEEAGFINVRKYDWCQTDIGEMGIDDYSQAYLPHMDKQHGQLMVLNIEADKPKEA
jgi:predicted SAM-dependent methyltransferase